MNNGTTHWLRQRITAIAMVPLTFWFVWSSSYLFILDRAGFQSWLNLHNNVNLVLFVIFISTLFYHMKLGVQVVIEDYVHNESVNNLALKCNTVFATIFGLAAVVSLLKLTFGA
tara:strand:- start:282 stop:623 length:342 start_codon:yes stop_codon:yes gene_type:complete